MPISYHDSPAPMANAPSPHQLTRDIQDLCRRLFFALPTLDKREKQFLQDQARREGHTLRSLHRLARIAAASPDPADRRALGFLFDREVRQVERQRALAGVSITAAEIEETNAEGELNNAQLARRIHDSAVNRERLRDCALRQLHATEMILEAL